MSMECRCGIYDLLAVRNCSFLFVWYLLLPVVCGAMSHYLLVVFALPTCAYDVMAHVTHDGAFMTGQSPMAHSLTTSFFPWLLLLSELYLADWPGTSLTVFATSFRCFMAGPTVILRAHNCLSMLGKTLSRDNGLTWPVRLWIYYVILLSVLNAISCFILSLCISFSSKTY